MPITHHSQLICYQRAVALRRAVYAEIAKPAWRKDWKLRDDIRRSARSVASNLSEGYWRYHHRDFLRFVDIALGSLGETEDHLECVRLDDIIDEDAKATLIDMIFRTRRPTLGLRAYLARSSSPERPVRPEARSGQSQPRSRKIP
jgi:four helix bundle protein